MEVDEVELNSVVGNKRSTEFISSDEDDTPVRPIARKKSLVRGVRLKADFENRPVYLIRGRKVYLEAFSCFYYQARDFLIAIAEPVSRLDMFHEYRITTYSIHGALAIGLDAPSILQTLDRLCKTPLLKEIVEFVEEVAKHFGNAKLVLKQGKFYVESHKVSILQELLKCATIDQAKKEVQLHSSLEEGEDDEFLVRTVASSTTGDEDLVSILDVGRSIGSIVDASEETNESLLQTSKGTNIYAVQISGVHIEAIKRESQECGLPLLEEYEFYNCSLPILSCHLKPTAKVRPYQEKSLRKIFGNGRARSGNIVLPCGAGKTLVGVVAASTIRKSCIVLCTSVLAVQQWRSQFKMWTSLADNDIKTFASNQRGGVSFPSDEAFVFITTYSMLAAGRRSDANEVVIQKLKSIEWGLMLLDEVHVVPANTFRRVIGTCRSHCKIGLTATLVREDDLIKDLEFLIGPKLYEANWMDLTKDGYLARIKCVEVSCEMSAEFFREYLRASDMRRKRLLYVMNPAKFRACEYLKRKHERLGDKILIFGDDVFALKWFAEMLNIPIIYGQTKEAERSRIFSSFKRSSVVNTLAVSKVGDIAIDIPEATVIIQISSHFGSRRQEAQRLGRILRPKSTNEGNEFNAHFYSLVSSDTQEMYYSSKRQQYLIDQGYSFCLQSNIVPQEFQSQLATRDAELSLLQTVMCSGNVVESRAVEELEVDDEEEEKVVVTGNLERPKFSQVARRISALTGADDDVYIEYSNP